MLNEPGGSSETPNVFPVPPALAPVDTLRAKLRAAVEDVFFVEFETEELPAPITASYTGQLKMDSLEAYEQLDKSFEPLDHVPIMLEEKGQQVIRALKGRFRPGPRPVWPNVVLLILTILSLLYIGATNELRRAELASPLELLAGWPYALSLLLILGSHELGHYFAARRHKVAVTLPYFIPLPYAFGTMGAFIQLREPMRNRRVLLDVGAAGPLVGFLVAIPILIIGLATSPVTPQPIWDIFTLKRTFVSYGLEGNSILYALLKLIVFGRFLPDSMTDVFINQVASAGWVGMLVTAINLIPVGQLDGGHVMYSLFGDRARSLFVPLLMAMGALAFMYQGWVLWLFLLLFFGRIYATPLDNITKLDNRRRMIAWIALIVFVLVFIPFPITGINIGEFPFGP